VFARGLLVRRIAVVALAALLASTMAGCASALSLGQAVQTLLSPGSVSEKESAAERVAASLNASACADVAAAAAGDATLITYVDMMRSDLLDTLNEGSDTERRVAALQCIGALGGAEAVEQLGWTASDDSDADVRLAAAQALAADGSEEALDALIGSLGAETDDAVADSKAAMIARVPDVLDRVFAAYEATYDASETARIAAVARFVGEGWVEPLAAEVGTEHQAAAQAMLIEIGEPAVDKLVSMLRSKKYAIREFAAETLVSIERGTPGTVDRLMASIEDKDYKDVAKYYLFYIKLGQSGTESVLRTALLKYGTKSMALDYLNCGNNKLESAAETWAHRHGYIVIPGLGPSGGPTWGEGL